jgi:hypothetical protein
MACVIFSGVRLRDFFVPRQALSLFEDFVRNGHSRFHAQGITLHRVTIKKLYRYCGLVFVD